MFSIIEFPKRGFIIMLLVLCSLIKVYAQNFPFDIKPMASHLVIGLDHSLKLISQDINCSSYLLQDGGTLQGISFKAILLFFESDKLTMMSFSIADKKDIGTIQKALKAKYKSDTVEKNFHFKNGNISISLIELDKVDIAGNIGYLQYSYSQTSDF